MKNLLATAALAALVCTPVIAEAQSAPPPAAPPPAAPPPTKVTTTTTALTDKQLGSRYLRCDGEPNNVTGGETFARLLGAVTLLGLFAPTPESPDPSKRQFGEAGVAVCSELIDGGDKGESNAVRRIPLILARALHQIEAKNYPAALADVEKARAEAKAAGLSGNAYFDRSMGLSFSNIEAEIHLRMGNAAAAQDASLGAIGGIKYSFVPSIVIKDYGVFVRELTPAAEARIAANAKVLPVLLMTYAARLAEVGRFPEAAAKYEALIEVIEGLNPEEKSSDYYARAALAHALAGDWDKADARASFARANMTSRRAEGKPEDDAAEVIELLDLFDIVKLAQNGNLTAARRNFAARSEWAAPSFGSTVEVTRRLREGAAEAELFGALSKTPEGMWQARYDDLLAVRLQRDTNNEWLFDLIQPYSRVGDFEGRSKATWQIQKSKMMAKEADEDGQWRIWAGGDIYSAIDAIMLHAALQAQARGKEGFTMFIVLPRSTPGYYPPPTVGYARFANPGEPGAPADAFIPAAEVITELSQVIPTPEELKLRKKRRAK